MMGAFTTMGALTIKSLERKGQEQSLGEDEQKHGRQRTHEEQQTAAVVQEMVLRQARDVEAVTQLHPEQVQQRCTHEGSHIHESAHPNFTLLSHLSLHKNLHSLPPCRLYKAGCLLLEKCDWHWRRTSRRARRQIRGLKAWCSV